MVGVVMMTGSEEHQGMLGGQWSGNGYVRVD